MNEYIYKLFSCYHFYFKYLYTCIYINKLTFIYLNIHTLEPINIGKLARFFVFEHPLIDKQYLKYICKILGAYSYCVLF